MSEEFDSTSDRRTESKVNVLNLEVIEMHEGGEVLK